MTDELVYERLAISIAQTHSVLPRLHGEVIRSLAQVYPVLISPWFLHGYVPEDLRSIHIFNAWLMSSACIPAFLLARRVTGRRWVAYLIAVLTVFTPWIIYSTTLLTEVAAFPIFMWAILAMHRTLTAPSTRSDVLALLALGVAFFTRAQFILLAGVLPLALLVFHLVADRERRWRARLWSSPHNAVRSHPFLAAVYAAIAVAALAAKLTGGGLLSLSVYSSQASGNILPRDVGATSGHLADLAFGIGILPFLVGGAWLLANAVLPSATRELQAFACIGSAAVVIFAAEITAWDLHIGNFVIDRYLFYLVPLLLLGVFCALLDPRRPRWSLIVPAAFVAVGFRNHLQQDFLWSGQFPLSTDSPIATLYKPIARLGGGMSGASTILVVATLVLAALFVLADRVVPHGTLTVALSVALLVALPADTGYTFEKLLSRPGHSGRPLTRSVSGSLDWLDRAVGTDARVTEVPYTVSTDFFVTQEAWRDVEFWNKSVRYRVHYPTPDAYNDAVIWFPNNPLTFAPNTGKASSSLSPYVVQSVTETRFRISGTIQVQHDAFMVIAATTPWRTDWLTSGLYDDGWTRPGEPVRIRVFAVPGQHGAVARTLTLQLRGPPDVGSRRFSIVSNLASVRGETGTSTVTDHLDLCVPASGFADVRLTAQGTSAIPGDQRNSGYFNQPREGGLLVADLALADEIGGPCTVAR